MSTATISILLHLLVDNYAALPSATVTSAMTTSARLLKDAAVETKWSYAGGQFQEGAIKIRILPPKMASKIALDGVCGLAVAEALTVWVSVECASRRLAAADSETLARFLGHVIAHEIGHIVRPGHKHDESGLMSGHWGKRELVDLNLGRLRFARLLQEGNVAKPSHGEAAAQRVH
jgi:hypothetical protein